MLGLSVSETASRIGFIEALSGEARSSAISQLAKSTGRNEAQVEHALERYNAATQVGTADGASREAAREGTSVYGRTREAAGYDFAEHSGRLDAQREVGPDGTRSAARIGEERHQADNEGFAAGAAAAGVGVREAAHLDSFIRTLGATAGNQVDIGQGGPAGVADRAGNARTIRIVDDERLTRMQGMLRAHGITMTREDLALAQNGDLSMNVSAHAAGQLHRAGLINDSQWGAIANGGHARFSFSANDLLVSSAAGFEQSARNDSSTKFEAGKQAGPDTIEQMLGGGAEGHARMAQWLKGGFEMDRKGQWRLKPQVADTLERDITAMMAQTGWQRSIVRSADDQTTMGTDINADIGTSVSARSGTKSGAGASGFVSASAGFRSSDRGQTSESAQATIDIMNYEIREAVAHAERAAAMSKTPAASFASALSNEVVGNHGMRNRLLEQADSARGTADIEAPVTSVEQSSILSDERFFDDLSHGPFDGDPAFKERRDQ